MSNVLLIKGRTQYNAERNCIDEIEIGFRLAGYNVCILDALDKSVGFQINELKESVKIDIIFACNANLLIARDSFPDAYCLTYMCDHPAFYAERLSALDERSILFVCDRHHEKYIQRYFPNICYVKYVPLSGSYLKYSIPYRERKIDVVFTGGYEKPEDMYEAIFYENDDLQEIKEYMSQSIIEHPEQDIDMCLRDGLNNFGIQITESVYREMLTKVMCVDRYARCYYRDQVIRSLIENGLQVHVYGSGWERFESDRKENLIIEQGNFYIAQKAVANAKISINMMPWFKAGFSESIASAMLSGTVAVTDDSEYIQESFVDGQELVIYSLKELQELPKRVQWLLDHEEEAEKIAWAGENRAENEMTWQHRTIEMIIYMLENNPQLRPDSLQQEGVILNIASRTKFQSQMMTDAVNNFNKVIDMITEVLLYDKIELCDVKNFYNEFLNYVLKINDDCPTVAKCINEEAIDYLNNLEQEQVTRGIALLIQNCKKVRDHILEVERNMLASENQNLRVQLEESNKKPNLYSQQVLIQRLKRNYATSTDPIIQEILFNIESSGSVGPYNQNFACHNNISYKKVLENVRYDEQEEMWYALWNGKKMYYPKGYTRDDVAFAVCFVLLEQDIESPHRYLDETFDVRDGDIVIDAGVAEGNFALDIVERAKKVYLVECEHMWIEALHRTFKPWEEKVVIIERMLGEKDDDQFASIDSFVEEGYVNFIKMDVEGAEIPSLRGAVNILDHSKDIRCAICSYHRKDDEKNIRAFLEKHHFFTTTTEGYMFFKEDMDSWIDGELRRGLVRACSCK